MTRSRHESWSCGSSEGSLWRKRLRCWVFPRRRWGVNGAWPKLGYGARCAGGKTMERGERWEEIKELFAAALEHDSGQRDAFLREACGQDHELHLEVASLVAAHKRSNELSQYPWREQLLGETLSAELIGPYRLIKRI